jgi:hypothetical protein
MAVGNELTSKFVRAHHVNSSITPVNSIRWFHKLLYEFWGFCVNGGNSLLIPGGYAPVSGVLFTEQWQSGSAVLLASGSDGVTTDGNPFFTAASVNWTSGSLLGKWLVTWKSSSYSTDDSVYPITQIINSSTIRVNVNNGGTPYTGSLHPSFTARTNVNFRVVDFAAAIALGGYTADADGLVLKLDGAEVVNLGQVTPHVRTRVRTSVGVNTPNIGLTLSSSGSWTPASSSGYFTDASAEINADTNASGYGTLTSTGYITLIAAHDFLLTNMRGWQASSNMSGFHVEIPQRLYPQNNDPNPICAMNYGITSLGMDSSTESYGGGFKLVHMPDGTTRKWRGQIRSLTGDYFHNTQHPGTALSGVSNGRFNDMFFNTYKGKFMMFDAILGLNVSQQVYAPIRCRLRRVRFTAPITPLFQRYGDFGEWINVSNGILWPWDNAIIPTNLFPIG